MPLTWSDSIYSSHIHSDCYSAKVVNMSFTRKRAVPLHFNCRSTDSQERCGLPWCTAQFPGCTISPRSTWRQESETSANVTHFEQSLPACILFEIK